EASSRMHERIPPSQNGDQVKGIFLTPQDLRRVQAGRSGDRVAMIEVPAINSTDAARNDSAFMSARRRWLAQGRTPDGPVAARAAASLASLRAGNTAESGASFSVREGDRIAVVVDSLGPGAIELVSVGRDPASAGGAADIHCNALVL